MALTFSTKSGLACVYQAVVFKTEVLRFKVENTPIKDANGKGMFKGMLVFPFVV